MASVIRLIIAVVLMLTASQASAARIKFVLLDGDNRTLGHGRATIIARSPEHGWAKYIGYYREGGYYQENLPDVDYLNISIYTIGDAPQKGLKGIYGHRDHALYLRTDQVGQMTCSAGETEYGVPFDLVQLVEDLDEAFSDGVARRLTNVRSLLQTAVLQRLDNAPEPNNPEVVQEKRQFRQRVMRHLR